MHFVKAKGILSSGNGINLYRGCSHGCIYCDARSKCYHIEHDFEDIEVKENAVELLEDALRRKRKKCMIGTGAMTDPYILAEINLQNTKKSLELIYKYGFGVTVHTKSARVLRDLEILQKINEKSKAVVQMTLTTSDENLCKKLEPNVSTTKERFDALKKFRDAKIPTVVWLSPILPFINDTEKNINEILEMCFEAKVQGIICFEMGLTLREGNREYFYASLDKHFPGLKEKYIRFYGNQYEVNSPNNAKLMRIFHKRCEENKIMHNIDQIFAYLHKFEEKNICEQLTLFDF